MPPTRGKGRKLPVSRISQSTRFSDTPRKRTPSMTARNSEITSEKKTRMSVNSQDISSAFGASDFLKANWKIFEVSPLYNFSKARLKTYARKLKEGLAGVNSKNENNIHDCNFQVGEISFGDKSYDLIQVSFSTGNIKYRGIFISSEGDQCKEEVFKSFPILLVEGGNKITYQVHCILCKFFDCDIYPVIFPFSALITFFASLSEMHIKDVANMKDEAACLHYTIPGCPEMDRIKIAVSLPGTATVFAVFTSQFCNVLNDEQITSEFYKRIINHILHLYKIDLVNATLVKIIFPAFAVSSEGLVRFSSEEVLQRTLPIIEKFLYLKSELFGSLAHLG